MSGESNEAQLEESYRERVRTGYCQFERDDIQVDPDAPVSLVQ